MRPRAAQFPASGESSRVSDRRVRPGRALRVACLALTVAAAVATGCERASPVGGAAPAVESRAERDEVRLLVRAAPATLEVGDPVSVLVQVEAPEGCAVELPGEAALGELEARRAADPLPRPGPSGRLWQRTFVLEPLASGELQIPALSVRYAGLTSPATAEATATQPAWRELSSAPLLLQVATALNENDDPTRPRDITGTLLPPSDELRRRVLLAVAAGALLAAAIGATAALALRRRRAPPVPPLAPEAWALRELAALSAEDWFADGQVAMRYYRLTAIVREYIERKFGLSAPEMTTEEFLVSVVRHPDAARFDPLRLRVFMEACDIVKYAAFTPQPADVAAAQDTARAYVQETSVARVEASR